MSNLKTRESKNRKTVGLVLAGGKSSRMGTSKAFLKILDKTFLEIAVEKLNLCCEKVYVVISKSQAQNFKEVSLRAEIVFDIFGERGALGGIYTGLKTSSSELVFVLAVDLPLVEVSLIKGIIKIANEFESEAVVAVDDRGLIQPLCAVYQTEKCLPKVEEIILEQQNPSVKDFLSRIQVTKVVSEGFQLFNVNTPEDYQKIMKSTL